MSDSDNKQSQRDDDHRNWFVLGFLLPDVGSDVPRVPSYHRTGTARYTIHNTHRSISVLILVLVFFFFWFPAGKVIATISDRRGRNYSKEGRPGIFRSALAAESMNCACFQANWSGFFFFHDLWSQTLGLELIVFMPSILQYAITTRTIHLAVAPRFDWLVTMRAFALEAHRSSCFVLYSMLH